MSNVEIRMRKKRMSSFARHSDFYSFLILASSFLPHSDFVIPSSFCFVIPYSASSFLRHSALPSILISSFLPHSGFVIPSSFWLRHSFLILASSFLPHSGFVIRISPPSPFRLPPFPLPQVYGAAGSPITWSVDRSVVARDNGWIGEVRS